MKTNKLQDSSYVRGLEKYNKRRRRISFRAVLVLLVVLFITIPLLYRVVGNNAEIRAIAEELEMLRESQRQLELENERLQRYFEEDNFDEYLERHAREVMGYTDPLERIFRIY
jgi:cell division protein FtsB